MKIKFKFTNIKYIKLFLIFSIFLYLSEFSLVQWESSSACKIQDWPAPVLKDYLNNVQKVTSNIKTNTNKVNVSSSYFNDVKSEGLNFYNSVTSWDWYFWTFNFYVSYPIFQHVPYPVTRDYKLIEQNADYINSFYQNLAKNWASDIIISNPCNWIENCDLKWTASKIISKLLENTNKVRTLYIEKITDNSSVGNNKKLILVPKNFEEEFGNYYNSYTSEDCSKWENWWEWDKWIIDTLEDSINEIIENGILSEHSTKDWKEGWNLLVGITTGEDLHEKEQQLLTQELARQWVSWDNSNIILSNLEDANSSEISFTNNPIVNSVKNTFSNNFKKIIPGVVDFSENISQNFFSSKWNPSDKKEIPVNDIWKVDDKISKSQDIKQKIDELYNLESPFAQQENISDENLMWRIIKIHFNIVQGINTLDKATPVAEKVCNMQDSWEWRCSYK